MGAKLLTSSTPLPDQRLSGGFADQPQELYGHLERKNVFLTRNPIGICNVRYISSTSHQNSGWGNKEETTELQFLSSPWRQMSIAATTGHTYHTHVRTTFSNPKSVSQRFTFLRCCFFANSHPCHPPHARSSHGIRTASSVMLELPYSNTYPHRSIVTSIFLGLMTMPPTSRGDFTTPT